MQAEDWESAMEKLKGYAREAKDELNIQNIGVGLELEAIHKATMSFAPLSDFEPENFKIKVSPFDLGRGEAFQRYVIWHECARAKLIYDGQVAYSTKPLMKPTVINLVVIDEKMRQQINSDVYSGSLPEWATYNLFVAAYYECINHLVDSMLIKTVIVDTVNDTYMFALKRMMTMYKRFWASVKPPREMARRLGYGEALAEVRLDKSKGLKDAIEMAKDEIRKTLSNSDITIFDEKVDETKVLVKKIKFTKNPEEWYRITVEYSNAISPELAQLVDEIPELL